MQYLAGDNIIPTMTAELELTAADLVCGVDFGSQDLEPDSCTKLEPLNQKYKSKLFVKHTLFPKTYLNSKVYTS